MPLKADSNCQDPRGFSAGLERESEAHHDLADNEEPVGLCPSGQRIGDGHDEERNDNGPLAAVEVSDHAGRNLERKNGQFHDRSEQHELEGAEPHFGDKPDEEEGPEGTHARPPNEAGCHEDAGCRHRVRGGHGVILAYGTAAG